VRWEHGVRSQAWVSSEWVRREWVCGARAKHVQRDCLKAGCEANGALVGREEGLWGPALM
jgi:hypothetical protein